MRPIPATRLGDAHGLLRAIEKRGRLRTDEFVTEFNLDELFPPDLENALGRHAALHLLLRGSPGWSRRTAGSSS